MRKKLVLLTNDLSEKNKNNNRTFNYDLFMSKTTFHM